MATNKQQGITVLTFCPIFTGQFDPVARYENCTGIERDGTVLMFYDKDGYYHRTSLAWDVLYPTGERGKEK